MSPITTITTRTASASKEDEEETEPLDELILPRLSTKPTFSTLLSILSAIAIFPSATTGHAGQPKTNECHARLKSHPGLLKWLTGIIANGLEWVEEEDQREKVWEEAGRRISERCGRTAMPDVTRTFRIPVESCEKSNLNSEVNSSAASIYSNASCINSSQDLYSGLSHTVLEITLHEPSITADNLGFKTWASSYLMSKRLFPTLSKLLPSSYINNYQDINILELGSGTGLVGITAAAMFTNAKTVTLTDLPEIVPNLAKNVQRNETHIPELSLSARVGVLDWTDPYNFPYVFGMDTESVTEPAKKFDLVLAADPLYSPTHPQLLTNVMDIYFNKGNSYSRAMLQFPIREGYTAEREEFWKLMRSKGYVIEDSGVDTGFDDWGGEGPGVGGERDLDDELKEKLGESDAGEEKDERNKGKVRCWWGVYKWGGGKSM